MARTWSLDGEQVAMTHRELFTASTVPSDLRQQLSVIERTATRPVG